jgi:hypothetical protein
MAPIRPKSSSNEIRQKILCPVPRVHRQEKRSARRTRGVREGWWDGHRALPRAGETYVLPFPTEPGHFALKTRVCARVPL